YLARQGRDASARPELLHVTNGESAGNTLRQSVLGGAVLPWQDVLHEGPVPAVPRPEMLRTRAEFLSGCGWGSRRAILSSLGRLVEELPAPGDGLSGTERRALHAIAAGASTTLAAFVAAQELEEAPFLGDAWFFRALSTLGRGPARLLETHDGNPLPEAPPL